MEVKSKRILSVITYYTLIALALAMTVGFIFALIFRDFPMWAKIIYFVWAGVVIATIIFDIVCTANNSMKFISGLIVYVLSVCAVAVSVIIYLIYTTRTGLTLDMGPAFMLITSLSYATTLFMIAEFIVGEALIEHNTSAKALRQRGVRE